MAPDLGLALNPLHLYQMIGARDEARSLQVLAGRASDWREVFAFAPNLDFVDLATREAVLATARAARRPFEAWHATPWNRTALRLEQAALASGGGVNIVEDGIANYRPPVRRRPTLKDRAVALALRWREGIRLSDHPALVTYDLSRTRLWSIAAGESADPRATQIDLERVRGRLEPALKSFDHLRAWQGRPVFFDANDAESGWLSIEAKAAILRDLLPREPVLWFPHPNQRHHLPSYLPQLVDMRGRTHGLNDLACWVLRPETVYSTFSSAVFILRRLFQLDFTNNLLMGDFLARTGHPAYDLPPEATRLLA